MGKTLTALKLVAGLLLYILDVGSDIYVAVRCHQEDKTSWCAITIAIVLVASTVIVNVVAFWTRKRELGICIYGVAFLGQLCVIVRYVEQLVCLKKGTPSIRIVTANSLRYAAPELFFSQAPNVLFKRI